jgi:hypothetical protein
MRSPRWTVRKPAVSVDTAFRILNEEAAAGLIDADIVGVFIGGSC